MEQKNVKNIKLQNIVTIKYISTKINSSTENIKFFMKNKIFFMISYFTIMEE